MSSYDTTNQNSNSRMVTGLFPDRASAERAYGSISDRGYGRDDVNLMMSDTTRKTHFSDTDTELGSKAAEGAGIGAGIGGTIGAVLAGIAAVGTTLVLPGLGVVVAGPLAAALAGKGVGGMVNPQAENEHWRNSYQTQPYYTPGYTYDDYEPAYALGYNSYGKYPGDYDTNEAHLAGEWDRVKGNSRLSWDQAKSASRAAWHKVERAIPGDADRDGR